MATIQDVAKAAGVSVATVSRVLNDSSSVTPETREAVRAVIKKLNYQPNLLGRNLRRMETRMVLVLLPNVANPFYSRVVRGLEDVARKNGYNIMLCNTDSDMDREHKYLEMLRNRLSDGVIFMETELKGSELLELSKSFPVVQCCEYREDIDVDYVAIDNFAAAYKAVSHLTSLGHKRIAMISTRNSFISTREREAGYARALADAGVAFDSELIIRGDYGFKSGIRAAKTIANMEKRPTAVFAISDIVAIGAMKALKEAGLKIPEDIAVVGFDDISFASMYDPSLTTISQPKYDMGCEAMNMLIRKIKGELSHSMKLVLEHSLKIRESTVK